jgi:4-hydroxy-4-methyl-2-oxoglutarate aldolase
MTEPFTAGELEAIRRVNTPTIANALEAMGIAAKDQTFTDSSIRSMFPEMPAMVGYAVTATMRSWQPATGPKKSRKPYWDYVLSCPGPRIVVIQDLDDQPTGALWGEVNSNIHLALGCLGVITNGTVRDIDEVRPLQFQFLASGLAVSHIYARIEEFNLPVTIGGMKVNPGDLIHADKHGAIVVPCDAVRKLPQAALDVEKYERPMIQLCKSPQFSTERLAKLMAGESI